MVNLIENTTNEIPADILINVNYYFIEKKYSTKTKYAYIDMMRRYCRIVTDLAEIDEKALKLVYYKISDGKSDGFKLQLRAAIKILYKGMARARGSACFKLFCLPMYSLMSAAWKISLRLQKDMVPK